MSDALRPPRSALDWRAYHDLRRKILFERRGRAAAYDPDHPDERRAANHPHLFWHGEEPIGTIRIDVDGALAVFRLVTIREDHQRRGHGRRMLIDAETFARAQGCRRIESHVAVDAVGFYEKCGFWRVSDTLTNGVTVHMAKDLLD
jgi:GNAT superfamily N-acetyltransferase